MESTHIITALADNNPGVLLRVSGLFSRRGYNISSLLTSRTEDKNITRMTIVAHGDLLTLEQIQKQLSKLIDVREVKVVNNDTAVCREHLMIKMPNDENIQNITNIANMYGAKIVDNTNNTIMFELTGGIKKLDSLIKMLTPYNILGLMKTGVASLERG